MSLCDAPPEEKPTMSAAISLSLGGEQLDAKTLHAAILPSDACLTMTLPAGALLVEASPLLRDGRRVYAGLSACGLAGSI